jgi:hypothetical protein
MPVSGVGRISAHVDSRETMEGLWLLHQLRRMELGLEVVLMGVWSAPLPMRMKQTDVISVVVVQRRQRLKPDGYCLSSLVHRSNLRATSTQAGLSLDRAIRQRREGQEEEKQTRSIETKSPFVRHGEWREMKNESDGVSLKNFLEEVQAFSSDCC